MGGTLRPCSQIATARGTVYIENLGDDDDWYTEGNETILSRADELADGGSIYALVVRPHGRRVEPEHDRPLRRERGEAGWPVIELGITP